MCLPYDVPSKNMLRFKNPSLVQDKVLRALHIHPKNDLIAHAPPQSGVTSAFGMAAMRVLDNNPFAQVTLGWSYA